MAFKDYIEKAKDYFNLGEEDEAGTVNRQRPQVVQNPTPVQPQMQAVNNPSPQETEGKMERKQVRQS